MKSVERKFERVRDTKRAVVLEEKAPEGEAEVVGTLYVKKWFIGDAKSVNVTVEVPDGTNE